MIRPHRASGGIADFDSAKGYYCFLLLVGLKSAPLVCQPVEEGAEEKPMVEEGSVTEQQLGLRQAEERLYRDYIHRLLKVKKRASYMLNLDLSLNFNS